MVRIRFLTMQNSVLLGLVLLMLAAGCQGGSGEPGEPDEPSVAERAIEELQARYDELAEGRTGDAVGWAQEDVENIGDWEYRIVELTRADLEAELNVLGNERWEAYWIEASVNGVRVYLKRPSISYLSRVPLSVLVRMLAGGGQ